MRIYCDSDTGLVRKLNEDAIACRGWTSRDMLPFPRSPIDSSWVLVADGMGGHAAGDIASQLVVDLLGEILPHVGSEAALRKAVGLVHQRVIRMSLEHKELRGMGSTIAGLLEIDDEILAFNAGDSRIYALQSQGFRRLSVDHRLGQALTSCLGGGVTAEPVLHVEKVSATAATTFLLCTDGLTNVVPEHFIDKALSNAPAAAGALIDETLRMGAPDNVSIAVATLG